VVGLQKKRQDEIPQKPGCYVLWVPEWGRAFGPFADEDSATLWASQEMPERVLFTVLPLFAKIRA
jgi:hypothetical protein